MILLIFTERGGGVNPEVVWVLRVFLELFDKALIPFGAIESELFLLQRTEYTSLFSRNQLFTLQRDD